jgi:hypothetical protein
MATKKSGSKSSKQSIKKIIKGFDGRKPETIPSKILIDVYDVFMEIVFDAVRLATKPNASMKALINARRRLADFFGMDTVPEVNSSPDDYDAHVRASLGTALLFHAGEHTTFKSEVGRFIKALKTIQRGYKRKKRVPGKDVQIAELILKRRGARVHDSYPYAIIAEVYGKDWKDMNRAERSAAQRALRNKLSARRSDREKKARITKR